MAKLLQQLQTTKQDCSIENLPQTRKEVFFDVLKLHWKSLLVYGLIFLLFCLPLHAVSVVEYLFTSQASQGLATATDTQRQEIVVQLTTISNFAVLVKIPCFIILAIGLAGLSKVIRQYAWEENVNFNAHFWGGVKDNWLHTVLIALIFGIMYAVMIFVYNLSRYSSDLGVSVMSLIPFALIGIFCVPIFGYAIVATSIYTSKFRSILNIGVVLTIKAPFKTLLALLCCLSIFLLLLVPNFIALLAIRIVTTLAVPLIYFGWYLFTLNQLDNFINVDNYPDIIGRGTAEWLVNHQDE